MLWFFIVLQTMTPFIHAHAGAVQLSHASVMQAHGDAHTDASYHALAHDEHGAEIAVAHGMPMRADANHLSTDVAFAPPVALLCIATVTPGSGLPAPPLFYLVRSDHSHPLVLAPPLA